MFPCHDFESTMTVRKASSCLQVIHRCVHDEPVAVILNEIVSEKLRNLLASSCVRPAVNSGYLFLAMCHLVNCLAGLQQMHH